MGTVRFGNDNFVAITCYGDYIHGNITICHVYYVESLGHNLFSVGQFYDGDLEVAFCSSTCYVRNLEGDDLLTGGRESHLYTIFICFLLDGPLAGLPEAAYLQPCIEQLLVPIHHAGDKTAVGETSLSFALMNVHARAKGAKKHAATLRQLMMEIVYAPLSSQTWVGEASTSAAPLSVEDYTEEYTEGALGSVVAVPKLECCHF
ncbi:hypothetical protein Tco_0662376 [Tanacetum coccineum]